MNFGLIWMIIIAVLCLMLFVEWIASLIDVLRSEFENKSNKLVWVVVLLMIPPLGAILYPIIAENQKVKKIMPPEEPSTQDLKERNKGFNIQ